MSKEKYIQGLDMMQFEHIKEISSYNNNYYKGFGIDLLYGKSDDDNTTEWYLIKPKLSIYLGESYTGENDILHKSDNIE